MERNWIRLRTTSALRCCVDFADVVETCFLRFYVYSYRVYENCARTKCPRLKWIKRIIATLLSPMNSWLLNTVYFSQFGCYNSEILLFFQDKSRVPLFFSLNVIQSLPRRWFDRLYWFRWIQLSRREKVAQLAYFSRNFCDISGLQHLNWLK